MDHYRFVVIETIENPGESSSSSVRAHPIAGQGYDLNMRVECSKKMRSNYPVGTIFVVKAKIVETEGGAAFLYTHYNWPYEIVSRKKAIQMIKSGSLN